ncbi:MAG TPA: thiamine pyrophosphate-dependent enzyme [Candidatus Limnocylindrales bacterium]|nr:thiamine pyrophosphate-dependent enzyme [Candidatus Limnocylindrales bacterium]
MTEEPVEPVEQELAPAAEPEPAPVAAEPVPPRTVGRLIADALKAAGVEIAFTVPGESFLGLLDALPDAGIRVVTTRHEGGAAFMAEAHGQLTGKPAACLATRAVGAANLAIGIHTARADSTPMFVLVGQVNRAFKGREAFQEIDLPGSIGRLAKWSAEIDSADRAESTMAEATRQALGGRPGPVLLSLPEDLLDELVPGASADLVPFRPIRVEPEDAEVRRVLHQLTAARRPVILAGAGVLRSRGTADLVRLAELLEVPVIASWRRPDVFPNDHRLFLGMTGYGAAATVRPRLDAADLILVLGCRLGEIASFGYALPGPDQAWVHVDLEPRGTSGGTSGLAEPGLAVVADARTFLRVARRRVSLGVLAAEPYDARRAANEEDRTAYEAAADVTGDPWSGPGIHPGRVMEVLSRVLPPQTVVTTDAGNFAGWAARGLRFRRPGTFVGPTSGAMGFGLPAAIAASIEHPGRPVVALAGDGGFAMTMSELATAARERATVVALVFDNQRYGTIRAHQDRRGTGAGELTDLGPIDFVAAATALGVRGVRVDDDAAFEPALTAALALGETTVIHLPFDRRWRAVGVLDPA